MRRAAVIVLSVLVVVPLATSTVFAVLYFSGDGADDRQVSISETEGACRRQMHSIMSSAHLYSTDNPGFNYPSSWADLIPVYIDKKLYCPLDESEYIIKWDRMNIPEVSCPNHGSVS